MRKIGYQNRVNKQGREWINGNSQHNEIDDECCPDFSCCHPNLFESDRLERIKIFNKWANTHGFPLVVDA